MRALNTKASFDCDPHMEMLARAAPQATFNAEQWRQIESSLAAVGIDLNTATVDELAGPREWWGWEEPFYTPEQAPLRQVLQEWAYNAAMTKGRRKLSTPKQSAARLQEEVAALEKTLPMLDPNNAGPVGGGYPTDEQMDARRKRRRAMQAAMAQEIAERRECIAKLEAAGSSHKWNARTGATDYWEMLARKWLEVTKGKALKYRRQHLHRFLYVCSQPLLSILFEQEDKSVDLDRRLKHFLSNYFRPPRLPQGA